MLDNQVEYELFDENKVVQGVSCGWVDTWDFDDSTKKIVVTGWAFDPVHNVLIDNIIVVCQNGECIPAEVQWYDRSAVGEALNNPVLTRCGYILTFPVPNDVHEGECRIFAVLTDQTYAESSYAVDHRIN